MKQAAQPTSDLRVFVPSILQGPLSGDESSSSGTGREEENLGSPRAIALCPCRQLEGEPFLTDAAAIRPVM